MAGTSKKHLGIGIIMAISFFMVLSLIFSPVFGEGKNGLEFADEMFNKLAKGSSYFIPEIAKKNEKFMGQAFAVTISMDKPEDKPGDAEKRAMLASKLYAAVEGSTVNVNGPQLSIQGDLGKVLAAILRDADDMFHNDGAKLRARYPEAIAMAGNDEKKLFRQWHNTLGKIDKAFKKEGKIEESNMVSDVMKKGLEAAYNFYGIEAQKVSEKAGLMTGLLVFYVIYTMWYGFSIFFIFEGIGLTMTKAKMKKEV